MSTLRGIIVPWEEDYPAFWSKRTFLPRTPLSKPWQNKTVRFCPTAVGARLVVTETDDEVTVVVIDVRVTGCVVVVGDPAFAKCKGGTCALPL